MYSVLMGQFPVHLYKCNKKEATVLYVDVNFEEQRDAFDAAWGLGEMNVHLKEYSQ
ncbi:MAG: hypothetical protein NUV74_10265 [Candidatus Brocadiaceae bacterium]|nr:hypothetical protein [Candidatus Brocadiaceae bacterium]